MDQSEVTPHFLRGNNDIIISIEQSEVTAPTLLDLSAAFDTNDHATLANQSFRLVWNIWAGSNLVFLLFAK